MKKLFALLVVVSVLSACRSTLVEDPGYPKCFAAGVSADQESLISCFGTGPKEEYYGEHFSRRYFYTIEMELNEFRSLNFEIPGLSTSQIFSGAPSATGQNLNLEKVQVIFGLWASDRGQVEEHLNSGEKVIQTSKDIGFRLVVEHMRSDRYSRVKTVWVSIPPKSATTIQVNGVAFAAVHK